MPPPFTPQNASGSVPVRIFEGLFQGHLERSFYIQWHMVRIKKIKKWGRRRSNTSVFVLICPRIFEIKRFEIFRKHPHPLFCGNIEMAVLSRGD